MLTYSTIFPITTIFLLTGSFPLRSSYHILLTFNPVGTLLSTCHPLIGLYFYFLTSWCCLADDVQTTLVQPLVGWIIQISFFLPYSCLVFLLYSYVFSLVQRNDLSLLLGFWMFWHLLTFFAVFFLAMKRSIVDFCPLMLLHVTLCCSLWLKNMFMMRILLNVQKSISRFPFAFIPSIPCVLVTVPILSFPTWAFKSPAITKLFLGFMTWTAFCRCS